MQVKAVIHGEEYLCSRAVKGADFVRLYSEAGNDTAIFSGISDFSGYSVYDGGWETPPSTEQELIDSRLKAVEEVVKGTPTYGELLEAVNILLGE